jgi:hypothetical protein
MEIILICKVQSRSYNKLRTLHNSSSSIEKINELHPPNELKVVDARLRRHKLN